MATSAFPEGGHSGVDYYDFMESLSRKRSTQRYLEIGVNQGLMMSRISARTAVGVDPAHVTCQNVTLNKERVTLISAPSDLFFASPDMVAALGGPPDLAFLDGYHTFEFLLRDFYNTERISTRNSLIAMHDCLPLDQTMAIRHRDDWNSQTAGTRYAGAWTGDVWKIVPILLRFRPDLRVVCTDCTPTGLVFVTNLDPSSTVLSDSYLEIASEFLAMDNHERGIIENLYKKIDLVASEKLLREFDHSIFFRS